jgi:nitrate reductase NapE component
MAKIWNTQTKRIVTSVMLVIAGWSILATNIDTIPSLPSFIGNSFLTLVGAYLLFAVWMLNMNELNG